MNKIKSIDMVDVYTPKIEGLDTIEQKRRVTAMETVLSKTPFDEDGDQCKQLGYQQPEKKEERENKPYRVYNEHILGKGPNNETADKNKGKYKRYNDLD